MKSAYRWVAEISRLPAGDPTAFVQIKQGFERWTELLPGFDRPIRAAEPLERSVQVLQSPARGLLEGRGVLEGSRQGQVGAHLSGSERHRAAVGAGEGLQESESNRA